MKKQIKQAAVKVLDAVEDVLDHVAEKHARHNQSSHGRGGGGGSSSGGGSAGGGGGSLDLPKKLDDASAKAYVVSAEGAMKKAGLPTYVSDKYTDSQLGGLNQASNVQNWKISDGDTTTVRSFTPKGHADVGVAVWGRKAGIKFDEVFQGYDQDGNEMESRMEPDRSAVKSVANKIKKVFKKNGANVVSVTMAGYDGGFGTGDVGFQVRIKK